MFVFKILGEAAPVLLLAFSMIYRSRLPLLRKPSADEKFFASLKVKRSTSGKESIRSYAL